MNKYINIDRYILHTQKSSSRSLIIFKSIKGSWEPQSEITVTEKAMFWYQHTAWFLSSGKLLILRGIRADVGHLPGGRAEEG